MDFFKEYGGGILATECGQKDSEVVESKADIKNDANKI